ncbi:helix-turn-helix domain-containing protein [Paraurantiacibacter namhicola]|uniref:HTH-type transcriptional regulator CdhR n=1 Tax=Paraurantiacibacter namhicola TaxID=645517 RepID=A0A1C7D6A3_9SPHN|nr:AraC family transcriptional regulator [Paraurantiacibacter namhicola]ANU06987.1 HTH-type transcriptional regulator CdhR [Paraurantiacibacter namhicola]
MEQAQDIIISWRSVMLAMPAIASLLCLAHLYIRDLERPALRWLAAFVIAALVSSIPMIIGFSGAYKIWPGLTFLPVNLTLAIGPMFYLHAARLMEQGRKAFEPLLFLPFALHYAYQWWAFTSLGDYRAKWDFNNAWHEPVIMPLAAAAALVLAGWALLAVRRMHRRYVGWLEDSRSDGDAFEANWIGTFLKLTVPLAVVWGLIELAGPQLGLGYVDTFWPEFALQAVIFIMCMEALGRIQRPYPKMPQDTAVDAAGRAQADTDQPRDWQAEGERIGNAIRDGEWFLEPALSLQDVARRCATNQAYVSRAFNRGRDETFGHFVNGLRVARAQELMKRTDVPLIDIALEAGFGSKASFNRAFRLHAGMAPSSWRSARLNS